MKRLIKFCIIFFLVICGILVTATAILNFVNLDPYRERIAGLATQAIGRQVKINGHIEVKLFPHPEVILNEVSLANASWGSEPTMASIQHVDASISFLSLFSDMVVVRRVRLNGADVLLEQNNQRVGNWVVGEAKPPTDMINENSGRNPDEVIHLPAMVEWVELDNITITVRTAEGTAQVYHLSSFSLRPADSGNLILNASGELLGSPMTLDSEISSKASVADHGAVNADFQMAWGEADLSGHISTSRLATLADLQGTFNLTVKDIQKTLKQAEIEAPLTGPLTADATVNLDRSVYKATVEAKVEGITAIVDGTYTDKQVEISSSLTPLRRAGELFDLQGLSSDALKLIARLALPEADHFEIEKFQIDVGQNRLTAQGRVNTGGDAALSLALASPDLQTFLEALPPIDFNAEATVKNTAEKTDVSDMVVTFDKSDIGGDITLLKGEKPAIRTELTSKLLDLRPFGEPSKPGDKAMQPSAAKAVPQSSEKKNTIEDRYVFKETPLPLEPLKTVEADAKIGVKHFYYDIIELKDVVVDAKMHGGHLEARFKCDSPNAGHAAGKIDLQTQGEQATVDTLVYLSEFRLNVLKAEGVRPAEMPPTSVSLHLKTTGASPRQLASVANGRILLTQGSGKIKNTVVGKVSGDVFAQLGVALNPFAKHEEFSNWDCTVVRVQIVDGHANIDDLLAQGEKVMIVGGGAIDLKTEKLNIEFNTKPREGIGVSADMFVTPFVKVTGTLAQPGIGLDKKGALLSGGAAVATGGLSVLVKSGFDRATAEGDQCEKTMETAGEHTRYDF